MHALFFFCVDGVTLSCVRLSYKMHRLAQGRVGAGPTDFASDRVLKPGEMGQVAQAKL